MRVLQFHADEIFEMAMQIERNGEKFYLQAAERATKPQMRQLLSDLAGIKNQHKKVFAEMKTKLPKQRWNLPPSADDHAASYLQARVDAHVFDIKEDPSKRFSGKETVEDILKIAIGVEKDSITFYLGIKEVIPEKWGRDSIDTIIKEEMQHIVILGKELASQ